MAYIFSVVALQYILSKIISYITLVLGLDT